MNFVTTKIEWTDAMKSYAEDTIRSKLSDQVANVNSAEVKVEKLKEDIFKVTVFVAGFRSQVKNESFYGGIDDAVNTIKTLVNKHNRKKIVSRRHSNSVPQYLDAEFVEDKIAKRKNYILDTYTEDVAVSKMEQTDYAFYLFRDADENNDIALLYRRNGDDLFGLIICK